MVEEDVDIDDILLAIEDDEISELLRRKNAYMEERKRTLGTEYYSSKQFWDRMWENEWDALEERINIKPEDLEGLDNVILELPTIEYEGEILTLYTFEDFSLMHNQGIFRETKFLIDKEGKWTKNIVNEMKTYGYEHIKTIIISREKYLIMREING
tara:strand:- start:114 stop:581 length:468 start_codon:yes stop_codon:yes gene_type:complete